jgi:hypothetical protein
MFNILRASKKNYVEIDFIQFPVPSLVSRSVVDRDVVTVVSVVGVVVVLNRGVVVQSIVVFVSSTVVALPYNVVVALMSASVVALALVAVVAFADIAVVALLFSGVVTALKPLPSPPLLPTIGIKFIGRTQGGRARHDFSLGWLEVA